MKKIFVHRFENEKFGKFHLPFFKKFDKYLSNFFDVEVINYNIDENTFSGNVDLRSNIFIKGFGDKPPLNDVEYLIENPAKNELKLISATEFFNHCVSHYVKSEYCSSVLLTHYNKKNINYWMNIEGAVNTSSKVSPWVFFPAREFDSIFYFKKRKKIKKLEEKLFYTGSGIGDYRKVPKILENKGFLQETNNLNFEDYMDKLIRSKIGISYYMDLKFCENSYNYPGEFCYRDIEYMSVGLPFIRIEYEDELYDNLIPNKHYIPIDRNIAFDTYVSGGDDAVANLFISKYLETKDNDELLKEISKNQIKWFNKNIQGENLEKSAFKLLDLKSWL